MFTEVSLQEEDLYPEKLQDQLSYEIMYYLGSEQQRCFSNYCTCLHLRAVCPKQRKPNKVIDCHILFLTFLKQKKVFVIFRFEILKKH